MIPDRMALTVHGKKRNIHRNDFLAFAQNCGISEKAAENMIRSILKRVNHKSCGISNLTQGSFRERGALGDAYFISADKNSLAGMILPRLFHLCR